MKKIIVALVVVGLFLGPKTDARAFSVSVRPGYGMTEAAQALKAAGVIRSEIWFKFLAIMTGRAHRLKPGVYDFPESITAFKALKTIARGPEATKVTIVEGETVREITEKLLAAGVVFDSEKFLAMALPLEGYLFPDTYEFAQGSNPERVIAVMTDNFLRRFEALGVSGVAPDFRSSNQALYRLVTLASIVEKEVPTSSERPTVAGIFEKRLGMGMPLQADATVVYAVCGGKFRGCPSLKRSDYDYDSPYNTYKYSGLPAGPIGNPGIDALRAVAKPKISPYLYYLSDPKTDRTIFSATFDEHNDNRAIYLGR